MSFPDAARIAETIVADFNNGGFDVATLVYNEFKSVLTQLPKTQQLIPFSIPTSAGVNENKKPEAKKETVSSPYSFEPSEEEILAQLLPKNLAIQIFRALPSYRGESQFGTWAHRIAVNRTLNALRRTRRLTKIETDIGEETVSVEHGGEQAMLRSVIDAAAAKLSPGARTVFLMLDVEGYTHEEIATELGITPGGSKSQLFKARAKLRRLLAHLVDGQRTNPGQENAAPAY